LETNPFGQIFSQRGNTGGQNPWGPGSNLTPFGKRLQWGPPLGPLGAPLGGRDQGKGPGCFGPQILGALWPLGNPLFTFPFQLVPGRPLGPLVGLGPGGDFRHGLSKAWGPEGGRPQKKNPFGGKLPYKKKVRGAIMGNLGWGFHMGNSAGGGKTRIQGPGGKGAPGEIPRGTGFPPGGERVTHHTGGRARWGEPPFLSPKRGGGLSHKGSFGGPTHCPCLSGGDTEKMGNIGRGKRGTQSRGR